MSLSLQERLGQLPRSSAQALGDLLLLSHLSEEDLICILDASKLAGTPQFALGFAVTYLHLCSTGVPMRDVIRMAQARERRVNLRWSRKRWQEEHTYLSRAETLGRLVQESVRYELDAFQQHLPARWRGYLITESRRLGAEGLRQAHCVASYHQRILRGALAIAVVFYQRQRWTVELRLGTDQSLSIGQIRTRFNRMPDAKERAAIYSELGILMPVVPAQSASGTDVQVSLRENWQRVLPILVDFGVHSIEADFDGYGDSGNIETPSYSDVNGSPIPKQLLDQMQARTVRQDRLVNEFDNGRYARICQEQELDLLQAVELLIDETVEQSDVDWWNNDGGYGQFYLNVPNEAFNLSIWTRFSDAQHAHDQQDVAIESL